MTNQSKKILKMSFIFIGGVIGFFALTFVIFMFALRSYSCGNQVLSKSLSPNGEQAAYVFKRDCGATTSYSYHLSILNSDDELQNKSGNTFHADKEFDVKWNQNELVVDYPADAKIYEQDKRVGKIIVNYTSE